MRLADGLIAIGATIGSRAAARATVQFAASNADSMLAAKPYLTYGAGAVGGVAAGSAIANHDSPAVRSAGLLAETAAGLGVVAMTVALPAVRPSTRRLWEVGLGATAAGAGVAISRA